MLGLINGVIGIALLFAGRKLFWLFIGALGFVTGARLTATFWQGPDWMLIVIGLIVGIIFALLATFLQSLAILLAGFLAGGYVLSALAIMLGMDGGRISWVIYIIGGFIGMAVINFLFDWAVITLSSFAGAALITQNFLSQTTGAQFILIILVIVGIVVQGSMLRRQHDHEVRDNSQRNTGAI